MSWIKKEVTAEVSGEMEYENTRLSTTDAYEVKITEAYLKDSSDEQSKSKSLVITGETEDGLKATTYFTVLGRDGETFFESTVKGKKVKKQHFGLNIVNTVFMILLDGKEIFDCEPAETEYQVWNKEDKELEDVKGDGFPELIGKKIGITYQMKREIDGTDTKEFGEIAHFFDTETGLFCGEEDSDNLKLDKWMNSKKEFIVKTVEKPKSSFGNKKKTETNEDGTEAPKKKRWGR